MAQDEKVRGDFDSIDWSVLLRRKRRRFRYSLRALFYCMFGVAVVMPLVKAIGPALSQQVAQDFESFPNTSAEVVPFFCLLGTLAFSLLLAGAVRQLGPRRAFVVFSFCTCVVLVIWLAAIDIEQPSWEKLRIGQVKALHLFIVVSQSYIWLLPVFAGFGWYVSRLDDC